MAATRKSKPLRKQIKRSMLWRYLNYRARKDGINKSELHRVKRFIDNKFIVSMRDYEFEDQKPSGYFPGLSAVPVHDHNDFGWVSHLENHAEEIRGEFIALRNAARLRPHPQNLADSGAWNTFHLYSNGTRYDENCDACPVTTEVLNSMPGTTVASQGQAYFSVMDAGTHVLPHFGPTNTKLRCHLGLIVPDSSVIRVSNHKVHWRELGCIVFDDSFEHEVWNPDEERAVLIIDIWHPDLTPEERWAVTVISGLSRRNRKYRQGIQK